MQAYMIVAWSPSTNQKIREITLNKQTITDPREADLRAASFAMRLNQQRKLHVADWQPQVTLETVGDLETLDRARRPR